MISKKELLAKTGISYGQLYRWKREGLIPEEWFIKKSSYTGQETFFPKEQVLGRVGTILELKDNYSLDELSKILSSETSATISQDELREMYGINRELLDILDVTWNNGRCEISEIAFLVGACQSAKKTGLTEEQLSDLINLGKGAAAHYKNADMSFTVFLVNGSAHTVFFKAATSVVFDSGVVTLDTVSIGEVISKIASNLAGRIK